MPRAEATQGPTLTKTVVNCNREWWSIRILSHGAEAQPRAEAYEGCVVTNDGVAKNIPSVCFAHDPKPLGYWFSSGGVGWNQLGFSICFKALNRTSDGKQFFAKERLSCAKVSVQTMMQYGRVFSYEVNGSGAKFEIDEPMLCKGLFLDRQTADYLVEGMLRRMPVQLNDTNAIQTFAESADICIFAFSMDRASANIKALQYFSPVSRSLVCLVTYWLMQSHVWLMESRW